MTLPAGKQLSLISRLFFILLLANNFDCQALGIQVDSQVTLASLRQHPYLLTTPARVTQLRHAIQTDAWQAQNWQRLKSQADKLLGQPVVLPPRAGNWEHYYVDTVSGTLLRRGPQLADWQWEHQNPRTGQLYRSRPGVPSQDYDGVVLGTIHDAWALGVVQLGLAYQLSGDAHYARKARQILLAYADLYPQLPVVNRSRGRNPKDLDFGKAHVQPLEEATWLIDLVQGADLVWPALSKRDQQLLKKQLFAPAASLVDQPIQPTPNIVCWENAAIGMVGLLMQDQQLLDRACNHPTKGFRFQVANNILSDGFWVEQTPAYHLYALQALITLGQAAANAGYPADLAPLKKMLDAPLQLADAALVLPAFNDSHRTHLLLHAYLYEWGYARFHDATYLEVLRQSERGKTASKGTSFLDWALLYGEQALPAATPRPLASHNFPISGLGRLVKGPEDNSTVLCLKYTPYVNGHSHRDQLSFVLQKGNEQVAVDPGVNVYGDPAHWLWYQNSAAHNTFMLNQLAQRPSTTQCLAFGQSAGSDYLMVETRNAYDSVRFVRTAALLTENIVLFIDQAQVRRAAHNLTVAYHQNGHWLNQPPSVPYDNPKTGAGFALLNNRQVAPQQRGASLLGQLPSGRQVRVTTDATSPLNLITANDPAITNGEVSSVFFQRPAVANTLFIWCVTLDGQPVAIESREPLASDSKTRKIPALQLTLRSAQGQQWKVMVNPDKQTSPSYPEPASCFQIEKVR